MYLYTRYLNCAYTRIQVFIAKTIANYCDIYAEGQLTLGLFLAHIYRIYFRQAKKGNSFYIKRKLRQIKKLLT